MLTDDLIIVHLSDLHIKDERSPLLGREEAIAAACQWCENPTIAIVAITGDASYGGSREEMKLFSAFCTNLVSHLRGRLPSLREIRLVSVPGNHDCSFTQTSTLRDTLLSVAYDKWGGAQAPPLTDDVLDVLLQPQEAFFRSPAGSSNRPSSPSLSWTDTVTTDIGSIEVLCINTAWVSQLKEKQGSLWFPIDQIPANSDSDITICIFHHPPNWLRSDNARAFHRAVCAVSDLVLSGHEHDGDITQATSSSATSLLVYGDALQAHGSEYSAFCVFAISLEEKLHTWRRFHWTGERYETHSQSTTPSILPLVHRRKTRATQLSEKWELELQDCGRVPIEDSQGKPIGLGSIFVEPNVRREDPLTQFVYEAVPASALLDADQEGIAILAGDECSGKSSLGKFLFRKAIEKGLVPVLLQGSCLRGPLRRRDLLAQEFLRQYAGETIETWIQLQESRRVVIVDDFHTLDRRRRHDLFEHLECSGSRTLIIASSIVGFVDLIQKRDTGSVPVCYRILPLKRSQREVLIKKWQLADGRLAETSEEVRWRDRALKIFDTILGRSFLPPFPFYVLSVVQCIDNPSLTPRESAQGYFYEMFIRSHLSRGLDTGQFDIILTYLSEVAWRMFSSGRDWMLFTDWQSMHIDYLEKYDISRQFENMREFLTSRNTLREAGDEVSFRYPYMYYYFVALYMRDRLDDETIRTSIKDLCSDLSASRNADVILFLAHLSRDSFVIDSVLSAAVSCYQDIQETRLGADVDFIREMGLTFDKLTIKEPDPSISRVERLKLSDEHDDELLPCRPEYEAEAEEEEDDAEGDEISALFAELHRALHAIDILGQILKNFPGSLIAERKMEVAGAAYSIGMRLLGFLLATVRDNRQDISTAFAAVIANRHPGWSSEQVSKLASRTMASLSALSTYGMIKRLARAIGSLDLMKTYDRMVNADGTNDALKLLRVTLDLDYQRGIFPQRKVQELARDFANNPLAQWALRDAVIDHFYMFPVKREVRQSVCAVLNVQWQNRMQQLAGDIQTTPSQGDRSGKNRRRTNTRHKKGKRRKSRRRP